MDKIQQAKNFLRSKGYFFQIGHIDDIFKRAKELGIFITQQQAKEIAEDLQENYNEAGYKRQIDEYLKRWKSN